MDQCHSLEMTFSDLERWDATQGPMIAVDLCLNICLHRLTDNGQIRQRNPLAMCGGCTLLGSTTPSDVTGGYRRR